MAKKKVKALETSETRVVKRSQTNATCAMPYSLLNRSKVFGKYILFYYLCDNKIIKIMDNKEVWRKVEGYDQPIEVSNLGNVRRSDGKSIKVITHPRKGYNHVSVSINGRSTIALVHRLVAKAFISKPEGKNEIDHINTIKTDNRVENLRWVDHKENCNNPLSIKKYKARVGERNTFYGRKHSEETRKHLSEIHKVLSQSEESKEAFLERMKPYRGSNKRKVNQLTKDGVFVREWESMQEVENELGFGKSPICAWCRGRAQTAYGFKWKYAI